MLFLSHISRQYRETALRLGHDKKVIKVLTQTPTEQTLVALCLSASSRLPDLTPARPCKHINCTQLGSDKLAKLN